MALQSRLLKAFVKEAAVRFLSTLKMGLQTAERVKMGPAPLTPLAWKTFTACSTLPGRVPIARSYISGA